MHQINCSNKTVPKTKLKLIPDSGGVHQHFAAGKPLPEFSLRLRVNGRRSWRKLASTSLKAAIVEARGVVPSPVPKPFAELVKMWLAAGCPGRCGPLKDLEKPQKAAEHLVKYFAGEMIDKVNKLSRLDGYVEWRKKFIRRGRGGDRTVDMDLATLSNILTYGTTLGSDHGFNDVNLIYRGRKRHRKSKDIIHARKFRPESAEVIHALARELFKDEQYQVYAWKLFFAMRTGCRDSELDKLTRAAATENDAGYIRWLPAAQVAESNDGVIGHLFLNRSKSGIEPWAEICAEFASLLKCFFAWHDARHGAAAASLPFFSGGAAAGRGQKSFGAKLGVTAKRLGLPHVTPHGMRSYFATKHWRDKKRPEEIARLMGDQSVALVQSTYADMEKGAKLAWVPKDGRPAWEEFVKR